MEEDTFTSPNGAKPNGAGGESSGPQSSLVVTARIGNRAYALPAAQVEQILPMAALIPLPGAPAGVAGLLNYRGTVLPVVDPRPVLGLEPASPQPDQHLVLVRAGTRYLLWLDRAEEVIQVPPSGLENVRLQEERAVITSILQVDNDTIPLLSPHALDPGEILHAPKQTAAGS